MARTRKTGGFLSLVPDLYRPNSTRKLCAWVGVANKTRARSRPNIITNVRSAMILSFLVGDDMPFLLNANRVGLSNNEERHYSLCQTSLFASSDSATIEVASAFNLNVVDSREMLSGRMLFALTTSHLCLPAASGGSLTSVTLPAGNPSILRTVRRRMQSAETAPPVFTMWTRTALSLSAVKANSTIRRSAVAAGSFVSAALALPPGAEAQD